MTNSQQPPQNRHEAVEYVLAAGRRTLDVLTRSAERVEREIATVRAQRP